MGQHQTNHGGTTNHCGGAGLSTFCLCAEICRSPIEGGNVGLVRRGVCVFVRGLGLDFLFKFKGFEEQRSHGKHGRTIRPARDVQEADLANRCHRVGRKIHFS